MLKSITARIASLVLILTAMVGCNTDPDVVFEPSSSVDAGQSTDSGVGTDTNNPCAGLACDDNDPCTDDGCNKVTGKCEFAPLTGYTCDDGKDCTIGDTCKAGKCLGTMKGCSDGDPCTIDACNPNSGNCANTLVEGCAPEDPCLAMDCDDGNPCTDDLCTLSGCINLADNGNSCVTGSACTTGDRCVMGNCIGDSVSCDDQNPCTVDSCNATFGCLHEAASKGWLCDDGNANTVNDQCVVGACVGTNKAYAKEGDFCQADDACNDNIDFTVDVCHANKCTMWYFGPGSKNCTTHGECNDGNSCKEDVCIFKAGKCAYYANSNGSACSDGNSCTSDSCQNGQCIGTTIPNCGEPAPQCTSNAQCVDNSTCTVDTCVNGKCQNTTIANCGQPSNQPSYQLTVTWVGNAAAKAAFTAAGYNSLSLGGYCKGVSNGQVSGPDVVAWSEKLPLAEGATVDKMVFTKQVQSLAKCEFQVYAWSGNSQVAWGAFAGPVVLGSLSYSWDGYSAQNVGVATNAKGGYNWAFSPGNDTDGDGKVDSLDPSKSDGLIK